MKILNEKSILILSSLLLVSWGKIKNEEKLLEIKPPNIVFIMSDDHAAQAISAYGQPISQLAPTPNIDRIVRAYRNFEKLAGKDNDEV